MALQIGDAAPDFSLSDTNGNLVRLSDLKGRRVVLFFYPRDNTPGCTKEVAIPNSKFDGSESLTPRELNNS